MIIEENHQHLIHYSFKHVEKQDGCQYRFRRQNVEITLYEFAELYEEMRYLKFYLTQDNPVCMYVCIYFAIIKTKVKTNYK